MNDGQVRPYIPTFRTINSHLYMQHFVLTLHAVCVQMSAASNMDVVAARKPRRGRYLVVGAVVIALTGLGAGLEGFDRAPPRISRGTLWIGDVRRGELVRDVSAPGSLVSDEVRVVTTRVAGLVDRVLVKVGAEVEHDTMLIELANPDLDFAALEAATTLKEARAALLDLRATLSIQRIEQQMAGRNLRAEYREANRRLEANVPLAERQIVATLDSEQIRERSGQLEQQLGLQEQYAAQLDAASEARLSAQRARVSGLAAQAKLRASMVEALHVRAGARGLLAELSVETGQHRRSPRKGTSRASTLPLAGAVPFGPRLRPSRARNDARDDGRNGPANATCHTRQPSGVPAGRVMRKVRTARFSQAQSGVEADIDAVEICVLDCVSNERRELLGPTQPARKRNARLELAARRRWQHSGHRGIHRTGREAHDSNPATREIAGHWKREPLKTGFGTGVGYLTHLAVARCDRRGDYEHTAFAIGRWHRRTHCRRRQTQDIECTDQISLDDTSKSCQIVGLTMTVERCPRPRNSCARHDSTWRPTSVCEYGVEPSGVCHVCAHEARVATEFGRNPFTSGRIASDDCNHRAQPCEKSRGPFPQPRRASYYDDPATLDPHTRSPRWRRRIDCIK
jgi:multidrug efflux pump subunit AcrA (membrane-fusion protein)